MPFDTKSHVNALLAIQRALKMGLNLRYTIAGEGPDREAITSRIAELGLQSRVTLTGTLSEEEVFRHLSGCDAFVLPSAGFKGEAWPVSIMEAMAAGLPVISTIIGATPEMITSGVDGLLVAQGDIDAMAAAIAFLANSVDSRLRIGEAARQTARQRFDVSITAGALRRAISASLERGTTKVATGLPVS